MNEAMKMEESYVDADTLGNYSLNYFNEVLSPDFVKELMAIFGLNAKHLIKEFIFGVDILVELVNSPTVPMKRLLNNKDVTDALVFKMKDRAFSEGKPEYYGCQVNAYVTDLIDEFFERKYLRLFNYVLSETRPHLVIKLDGSEYLLTINKALSLSTQHCSVNFKNLGDGDRRIVIPFNTKRLTQ
jgi:hypothetical protein